MAVNPDDVVQLPDGRRGLVIGIDGDRLRVLLFGVSPSQIIDAIASSAVLLQPWVPIVGVESTRVP